MSCAPAALHIERYGEGGPTVVLCHGFGGSARNWRLSARDLKESARVIAFDARGHARSEAPEATDAYELECFIEDLAAVVDDAGVERVILGGLSMGAAISLAYSLRHPERVKGLLLASCPRSRRDPAHVEWAVGFAQAIDDEGLDAAGERYAWGKVARFNRTQGALIRQGFLEHPPHALAAVLRRVIAELPAAEDLAAELPHLKMPVRIVVGSEDSGSLGPCRELSNRISGAELTEIQGGGHVINLTHPTEFNAVLRGLVGLAS